ncbi:MAG TPA: hypothetical protein VIQ74_01510 [Gemmatimonadaceae bacterium]|jgi:hypothetical protein
MSTIGNVFRCVVYGIGSASIFAAWVVFVYTFRGPDALERVHVGLGPLLAFYMGAGVLGGLIVGLLWPILRWRLGAYFTSLVVALILTFALVVTLFGNPAYWDRSHWITVLIMTVIFGLQFGNSLWKAGSGR